MKRFTSVFLGFMLIFASASQAEARSAEDQSRSLDENLELIALAHLANNPEQMQNRGAISDLKDILENIAAFVEGFKDSFLATYDSNGNGRIDPGAEWNNLQQSIREIVLLVADTNYDGKVEPQEIAAVVQSYLKSLNEQVTDTVCTEIIVKAEKSGVFLNFRPVLKHLYRQCTAF